MITVSFIWRRQVARGTYANFRNMNVLNIAEELVNKLNLKMGWFLLVKEVACVFSSWVDTCSTSLN